MFEILIFSLTKLLRDNHAVILEQILKKLCRFLKKKKIIQLALRNKNLTETNKM